MTNRIQENVSNGKFVSKFRLEAFRSVRGMSMVFSGIIGVASFNTDMVILKSHGAKIEISGKHLDITVFENNDMEGDRLWPW